MTAAALEQIEQKRPPEAQDNSSVADERVARTELALGASRQAVEKLVSGVAAGLEDTQKSLLTIGRLEAVGRRIRGIVDEITLVAVQTSMLAVSGSVEAARAGDAGRGFAVVSNDIRTLAREASESVGSIKEKVAGILDQIAFLRRDLEQVIATAEAEVQTNRAIVVSLQTLDDDLAALKAASQSISHGASDILGPAWKPGHRLPARSRPRRRRRAQRPARRPPPPASRRGAPSGLAAAIEEIATLADVLKSQNE